MKTAIVVLSLLGSAAYGVALFDLFDAHLLEIQAFRATLVGFVAGTGIWLLLSRRLNFFSVFEHEITHLVFSLIMFQRPRSFYASDRRGHVTCDRGNFIDGLAPYFFPTFSYILLAFYPLLRHEAQSCFFPFLGLLTGYHLVSNIAEFKPAESDIRRYGIGFSLVFCIFAGLVTFGFILAFVLGGFGGGLRFIMAGWCRAGGIIAQGISFVRGWIPG
jgi:hypothetical protein